jgi:hypothetical protein
MSSILTKGVIQQGQVIVAKPIDLPDGTEVIVASCPPRSDDDVEEGWDNSPEGIAAWLQWYDSLEPLIFTLEEEADTASWLKKMNDYSIATMDKGIEDLFR